MVAIAGNMASLYFVAVILVFFLFASLSTADSPSIKTCLDSLPTDTSNYRQERGRDLFLQPTSLVFSDNATFHASMAKEHFRKIVEFEMDYSPSKITKYESKRTGTAVVVVDKEGPKVNGFFTFATEIFDDSGSPHTLEHLCFMGSKNYPYKGILDRLAIRFVPPSNSDCSGTD